MHDPILWKILKKIDDEIRQSKVMMYMCQMGVEWIGHNTGACGIHVISTDIKKEPMQIGTLPRLDDIKSSILATCLCNMVIAWQDLLSDLFIKKINQHFSGESTLPESITRKIKSTITLSDLTGDSEQTIKDALVYNFDFQPYKERLKIIEQIMVKNLESEVSKQITKVIEIRNVIQHHNSLVTEDLLKRLGTSELKIFNNDGSLIRFNFNEEIKMTLAEVMSSRNAFYSAAFLFFEIDYPFIPDKFSYVEWYGET